MNIRLRSEGRSEAGGRRAMAQDCTRSCSGRTGSLKSYAPEGPGDCGMHRQHTRQEPPICVPCAVRVRSTETSEHDCECRASRSGFNSAARVSVIESSHGLPDCRRPIERGESRPRELPRGVRHVWPGTDSRVAQSRSAGHELLLLSWAAASQRRARSPAIQVRTAPHILPAHLAPHTWLGRGLP